MSHLLHEAYLLRVPFKGRSYCERIDRNASQVETAVAGLKDVDVSVVIRSRNNARELELLLQDCQKQIFGGQVQIIVVDTESTDGTAEVAKRYGATVITIAAADFSYPKSLNLGFEAARYKWVFSFVDHSVLSNDQIFRMATLAEQTGNVGGVSGITLPNANATRTELLGSAIFQRRRLREHAGHLDPEELFMGVLAANSSLYNREAWQSVGGFDESYGAGGEDGALAAKIVEAGYDLLINPALSVHHTHGLGLRATLQQVRYWNMVGTPTAFNRDLLLKYRRDLRD